MKKLLLSLMVLATLMSCGKDNKVSSGSVSNGYSNGYLSGNASAAAQELASKISNYTSEFGNGLVLSSSGSSGQTCGTKWGFINYCYGSSGSGNYAVSSGASWNQLVIQRQQNLTYYYYGAQPTYHASVNVGTKQTQIMDLLNKATSVQVVQPDAYGKMYYIQVSNAIYVVDTRYPIQANPSAVKTAQGEAYLTGAY